MEDKEQRSEITSKRPTTESVPGRPVNGQALNSESFREQAFDEEVAGRIK